MKKKKIIKTELLGKTNGEYIFFWLGIGSRDISMEICGEKQ